MKSAERCREHYQGDRCRKARGHEGEHESNNASWDASRVTEKRAAGIDRHKRMLNRVIRYARRRGLLG